MGGLFSFRPQSFPYHEDRGSYPTFSCAVASAIPNLVGSGSFSQVYTISPTRVIKVLLPIHCNPTAYANLEASIYRALSLSPHILKFYGLPAPGVLELEYCPLGSVQTYIRALYNSEPDTLRRTTILHSIATQTVRALSHLHAHNVLHNDLGIRQLLLSSDSSSSPNSSCPTVKLVDFGSSSFLGCKGTGIPNATHRKPISKPRSSSSSSSGSENMETEPETETGMEIEYSVKADLFALGSTLYEIFARGCAPYWDLRDEEIMVRFEAGVWPALEGLDLCGDGEGDGIGMGERWKEVILGCWKGRFEGVGDILDILEEQGR